MKCKTNNNNSIMVVFVLIGKYVMLKVFNYYWITGGFLECLAFNTGMLRLRKG